MSELDLLRTTNRERAIEWVGPSEEPVQDLLFRATELGGEVGEALNVIKKMNRDRDVPGHLSHADGVPLLEDELADVIICVDRVAEVYGIDLWDAVVTKFNKTSRKHGLQTMLPESE